MFRTLKISVAASMFLAAGLLLSEAPQAQATSYGTGITAHVYRADVYYTCSRGHTHFYASYWVESYPQYGVTEGMGPVRNAYSYLRGQGYHANVRYTYWRTTYNADRPFGR
jgi:hypothetical protein